jgi:hypothetical protein
MGVRPALAALWASATEISSMVYTRRRRACVCGRCANWRRNVGLSRKLWLEYGELFRLKAWSRLREGCRAIDMTALIVTLRRDCLERRSRSKQILII